MSFFGTESVALTKTRDVRSEPTLLDLGSPETPPEARQEPKARKRVLYISATPLIPSKLGPARRNFHVLGQLSRFFDTTVLALGHPDHRHLLLSSFSGGVSTAVVVEPRHASRSKFFKKVWRTATCRCDFLPALEPDLHRACARLTCQRSFDAVVISSVFLRHLPLPRGVPTVADSHNVEFDVHRRMSSTADSVLRRLYGSCQWPSTRREEHRCGASVDLLLAASARDRCLFQQELNLERIAVVPNGIDLREFRPAPPSNRPVVLFSGLMSYYPNIQAIRWFMDAVFPIVRRRVPDAMLVVAGAAPPASLCAMAGAHIVVTGAVDDMRPQIAAAAVFVAPLLIGGGTRVKILEAQAMERPVVSTSIGAEGLSERHGDTILIGDDPYAFAAHVVQLLTDPVTAARIARNGRRHVVRHFDWDRIGARLRRLVDGQIAAASRPLSGPQSVRPWLFI